MSKAIVGLLAVGAVGGLAFFASKSKASEGPPVISVTGTSGKVYQVQQLSSEETPNGLALVFRVSDEHGVILDYTQFQGQNQFRFLLEQPINSAHQIGDSDWVATVQDFGISASQQSGQPTQGA